ncbi:uncharacterized protein LOC129571921, partial [Sitodiplosis mosellana]|uniref:uncharacterized protein LOC129571921 n=1 Tax=Sitodiplosis mosellana TaxID=263140 RepID=UPI00244472D5
MNSEFQTNESGMEISSRTLVSSFLFQCNLFKLVTNDATSATAQCMVCKRNGQVRYCKGKSTTNYHLHMKRMHLREYEEYLRIKEGGIPRNIIPFGANPMSDNDDPDAQSARSSLLFEHGFFEINFRMPNNKNIKANCMSCHRMGRSNLIQAREDCNSNLLAHLKRMHPLEYERYMSLKRPYAQQTELLPMFQPILTQPTLPDMDLQQSVVSTIKSEDLEFVDVNQDEMPGETWDSFESSDFYENLDNHQPHAETAASSTTKTIPPKWTEIYESGSNNDAMYGGDSNDESNEYSESSRRPPLLFRGGFFRFIKRDGA